MRPGNRPQGELARALLDAGRPHAGDLLERLVRAPDGSDERWLLVVDQFEECWTECSDDAERDGFLELLTGLTADSDEPHDARRRRTRRLPPADRRAPRSVRRAGRQHRAGRHPDRRRGAPRRPPPGTASRTGAGGRTGGRGRRRRRPRARAAAAVVDVDASRVGGTLRSDTDPATPTSRPAASAERSGGSPRPSTPPWAPRGKRRRKPCSCGSPAPGEGDEVVRRRVPLEELGGLPHDVEPPRGTAGRGAAADGLRRLRRGCARGAVPRVATASGVAGRGPRRVGSCSAGSPHPPSSGSRNLATRRCCGRDHGSTRRPRWPHAKAHELTALEHDFLAASREAAAARERAAEQRRLLRRPGRTAGSGRCSPARVAVLVLALVAGLLAVRARDREASAARSADTGGGHRRRQTTRRVRAQHRATRPRPPRPPSRPPGSNAAPRPTAPFSLSSGASPTW